MALTLLVWNFQFRKLKGELVSHDAFDTITTNLDFCYVGLERF